MCQGLNFLYWGKVIPPLMTGILIMGIETRTIGLNSLSPYQRKEMGLRWLQSRDNYVGKS